MEESDNLILMTLKQIGCKLQAESINQLGSDDVISIVLQLFKFLGIDITPFKIIDQSQKYRVANKIRDELRKTFSIQVDFTTFTNPSPNDIRKLLVSLISRMSAMEGTKAEDQNLTYEERLEAEKNKEKINILKEWRSDDWLLPELQDFSVKKRKFLALDLSEEGLKNHLLPTSVASNDFVSLLTSCVSRIRFMHQDQEKKERENDYRMTRGEPQTREKTLQAIAQNNRDAWTISYKKTANEVTFETKLEEIVKEAEEKEKEKEKEEKPQEEIPVDQGPTLYGLELQFQQKADEPAGDDEKDKDEDEEGDGDEEKNKDEDGDGEAQKGEDGEEEAENRKSRKRKEPEFDLEKIRAKHKAELEKISEALNDNQQRVVELEETMNDLETKKQKLEDELRDFREQNIEVEKKTEGLHELLQLLENTDKSEKELTKECDQLEKDMEEMKEEWNKQKAKMVGKIEKYKTTIEENKEKLEEVKSKIKFIETDYDNLVQKTKTNQEVRVFLQNEYANLPKEVSRNVFIKRINEINASYVKQKSDLQTILNDVEDVEKKMDFNVSLIERHCTEIENTLKSNPKPDSYTKSIFKVYQDFQNIFQSTIKNLKEHGKSKLEARDLERKIENLQSKNYGTLISKLQSDLEVLKQENEKMMHDYQRKSVRAQQK